MTSELNEGGLAGVMHAVLEDVSPYQLTRVRTYLREPTEASSGHGVQQLLDELLQRILSRYGVAAGLQGGALEELRPAIENRLRHALLEQLELSDLTPRPWDQGKERESRRETAQAAARFKSYSHMHCDEWLRQGRYPTVYLELRAFEGVPQVVRPTQHRELLAPPDEATDAINIALTELGEAGRAMLLEVVEEMNTKSEGPPLLELDTSSIPPNSFFIHSLLYSLFHGADRGPELGYEERGFDIVNGDDVIIESEFSPRQGVSVSAAQRLEMRIGQAMQALRSLDYEFESGRIGDKRFRQRGEFLDPVPAPPPGGEEQQLVEDPDTGAPVGEGQHPALRSVALASDRVARMRELERERVQRELQLLAGEVYPLEVRRELAERVTAVVKALGFAFRCHKDGCEEPATRLRLSARGGFVLNHTTGGLSGHDHGAGGAPFPRLELVEAPEEKRGRK